MEPVATVFFLCLLPSTVLSQPNITNPIGAFGAPIGPDQVPTICGGFLQEDVTAQCFQLKELVTLPTLPTTFPPTLPETDPTLPVTFPPTLPVTDPTLPERLPVIFPVKLNA